MAEPALIGPEALASRLGDPDLVVLDSTYYLPSEERDAAAEFAAAHIPGARFFDIDLFGDPDTSLPHMVPSTSRFRDLAARLGIDGRSRVVAYDQRGLFSAGRAWWLMRLFGVPAQVLDGGLPAWRAEGRGVENGAAAVAAPLPWQPSLHARRWRGLGDVFDNIASGTELLLDARAAPRFAGSVPEARPGVRSGHVPGARNLPFSRVLDQTGRMRKPAELRALLAGLGVDGTRPVVTMCGSGVTATVLNLAMVTAGLPEGAVYDGSWTEWGGRADMPAETDPAAKDTES